MVTEAKEKRQLHSSKKVMQNTGKQITFKNLSSVCPQNKQNNKAEKLSSISTIKNICFSKFLPKTVVQSQLAMYTYMTVYKTTHHT